MKIKLMVYCFVFCFGAQIIAGDDPEGAYAAVQRDDVAHLKKVVLRDPKFLKFYGFALMRRAIDNNSYQVKSFLSEQGLYTREEIASRTAAVQACIWFDQRSNDESDWYGKFSIVPLYDIDREQLQNQARTNLEEKFSKKYLFEDK